MTMQMQTKPTTYLFVHLGMATETKSAKTPARVGLQELVAAVCEELKQGHEKVDFVRLQRLMASYDSRLLEWKRYALFDEDKKYTRNLVATDGKTFTLLLLCWNPSKGSPVHDHSGSQCLLRVIAGQLREVLYAPVSKIDSLDRPLVVRESHLIASPSVTLMNDAIGLHKVENPTDQPAVTLHLYIPPYSECHCFLDETNKACTSSVTFHSVNGKLVNPTPGHSWLSDKLNRAR